MALPVVAAAVAGKRLSKKGRAKAKDKRAARQEKRADRKEKRADKLEAKGKGAKAAVKRAKAGVKRDKASKNTARAGELKKKAAANKAKRQEVGKKVKSKVKSAAKKVGKAAVKAAKNTPAGKAAAAVGKAGKKVKGAAKEVKKRAKAVVSAASGQPEMGKQPAMMKDMKQAAKNVKAGFEYGAKQFADEASDLYQAGKKKVKSAAKSVVDAKNRTFGTDFVQDNIVKPIKSDAKAVSKKLGFSMEDEQAMKEAKKEERGKGANLGSMSDGNAMAKKSMPMMRAGMKGGPSMMRIQYGNQASGRNMSNYARGNGKPMSGGPGMILSKHMKGPKMGHKK